MRKVILILLLVMTLPFLAGCVEFSEEKIEEIVSNELVQQEVKEFILSMCWNITTQIDNGTYHRTVKGFEC